MDCLVDRASHTARQSTQCASAWSLSCTVLCHRKERVTQVRVCGSTLPIGTVTQTSLRPAVERPRHSVFLIRYQPRRRILCGETRKEARCRKLGGRLCTRKSPATSVVLVSTALEVGTLPCSHTIRMQTPHRASVCTNYVSTDWPPPCPNASV